MRIQDLRDNKLIIFEGIVGSQAYGIATPTSDVDVKGVFIQRLEDILGFGYVEQINDDKNDTTFYEIRRFLELLGQNNPNILELLNLPDDCILYKDPIFDLVLNQKEKFISKACRNSFGGYAVEQIKKARGLNKKIVNPISADRKDIMDFCYVVDGYNSIPLKHFLENSGYSQDRCGLVNVPHARDVYSLFYDTYRTIPYKGIVNEENTSNEVRLSSIPKGETPVAIMIYNKDGYTKYCKDYKDYWDWVEKRNPQRYSDNMSHEGGYDGKNLAHCHRLLDMAIEIGEGKGINVRRENRDQLLAIRRGEYSYEDLLNEAEDKMKRMDEIFINSTLPNKVDWDFMDDLLITIRKKSYDLEKSE